MCTSMCGRLTMTRWAQHGQHREQRNFELRCKVKQMRVNATGLRASTDLIGDLLCLAGSTGQPPTLVSLARYLRCSTLTRGPRRAMAGS